jgi:hypothetical protein
MDSPPQATTRDTAPAASRHVAGERAGEAEPFRAIAVPTTTSVGTTTASRKAQDLNVPVCGP